MRARYLLKASEVGGLGMSVVVQAIGTLAERQGDVWHGVRIVPYWLRCTAVINLRQHQ